MLRHCAGGLPVLVSFLQEDYLASKQLAWNAVDCVRHVFDITVGPRVLASRRRFCPAASAPYCLCFVGPPCVWRCNDL